MSKGIVHVSGDYPDHIQPRKTKAVSSLIAETETDLDHYVYSINRIDPSVSSLLRALVRQPVNPRLKIDLDSSQSREKALTYQAIPGGVFLAGTMSRLADAIADDIVKRGLRPDFLHGHKLTLEGLIVREISQRLGCPYLLSVQVNTDRKILHLRPDLLTVYRRVYHEAAIVFPFSVMGQRVCDVHLGERKGKTILLPCTSSQDQIIPPKISEPVLASVFHLNDYKNKNVQSLILASKHLQAQFADYRFHLYGGGSDNAQVAIDRMIAKEGAVSFERKGPILPATVQATLNEMCGFVMVSKRETFGMVFLEALLAGCPVVFPKEWAIDGFFDQASFAIGVHSSDTDAIREGMVKLIIDQNTLKNELWNWQEKGELNRFQRENVRKTYVKSILGSVDKVDSQIS
ncbi:glycosyltransferase involved in cell wall biosynthesis [Labrenzia sp. EL_126]|nr:glycosyltransferase involved in cell wall biosynthesis [Labrenzia sp. EL_126]